MNRPPTPFEALHEKYWNVNGLPPDWITDNLYELQEALTCEWLIEQGLMPDPTEYMEQGFVVYREGKFAMPAINIRWECEDKTK